MKNAHFLLAVVTLALSISIASAYDPSPLEDFCVAINDPQNALFINGKFCKNPELVNANDFFTSGFNIPRDTNNLVGSNVTMLNVDIIPGLNTLGLTLVRIDFAPHGQNPPHFHPRGSEIFTVAEGRLLAGFVTSNQNNHRHFAKVLNKGDVFVFPFAQIHFQFNLGDTPAVAFAVLSSQNAGVTTIANTTFGANPPINPEFLARAFQLDVNVVKMLQNKFT